MAFYAQLQWRPSRPGSPARQRGSVLIVAMIIAGVIGISLASYLKLSISSLHSANRSFYGNSSLDYAEIGIEQAMACFYTASTGVAPATAWSGWTLDAATSEATRTFPTANTFYTPGPGAKGQVRVYVKGYNFSGSPFIVAKSTVTPATGAPIEKYVRVALRSRSLFSNGLVARDSIDWNGTPSADSWNSDPDNDPSTAAIPYSVAVRTANCTVGTVSATNGALDLANGTVHGSVATGGGSVAGSPTITGSVTYDFSASFPNITSPATASLTVNPIAANITATSTFPSAAVGNAINAADNTYYYTFGAGSGIDVNGGGRNIQIAAGQKVVFILESHTGVPAIRIGGNSFMNINAGGSLTIYTNGNLAMAGNGVANANPSPASCLIYGTRTTTGQTFTVSGNGQLRAALYAPNAAVTANGGGASGQIQGSIVAHSINMNGGPDFHYDQALGNLGAGAGVGVSQWKELQTAAERAAYAANLNF
jgi:hypothetical protein